MSVVLPISSGAGAYEVQLGPGLLDELGARCRAAGLPTRLALIADETVASLYGDRAEQALREAGFAVRPVFFAPGEASKSLGEVERLVGELVRNGLSRGDAIVALGGGVTGDLAGFIAATYHRGLDYVQVPTTFLAQVDSSVGGKVAVDHPLGKNLIGAFHAPRLVVADTAVLATLSPRERSCGLAELVKMALIADERLLAVLESRLDTLMTGEEDPTAVIARAVELKAQVVEADEREAGPRMVLNFGHTIGHAIEALTAYASILHGEAVVRGMRGAVAISRRLGHVDEAQAARAQRLLARLPTPRLPMLAPDDVLEALTRDKKVRDGALRFVVLDGLGGARLEVGLEASLLREGIVRALEDE